MYHLSIFMICMIVCKGSTEKKLTGSTPSLMNFQATSNLSTVEVLDFATSAVTNNAIKRLRASLIH